MILIIDTNGKTCDINSSIPPTIELLRLIIECDYTEIVSIFFHDQYEQMIVDETGALNAKPYNYKATCIYHENVRKHQPELLINAPKIHGIAIVLTGSNKLD